MGLSFKPSEASAGGGLWSDLDGTITRMRFVMSKDTSYKSPNNVPLVDLAIVDDAGVEYTELLSCGSKGEPNKDGTTLVGVLKMDLTSKLMILLKSMTDNGLPENKIEDDNLSCLEGGKFHWERVAAPKRPGLIRKARADGRVFEETNLTVSKVLKLPWDTNGKGKVLAKGKAAPARKGKGGGEVDDTRKAALDAIAEVILQNAEGMTKQQLSRQVFQLTKTRSDKVEIIKLVNSDEFLEEVPDTNYSDGVLSLA